MDPDIKDVVQRLLVKVPENRLGAGPKGSDNDYEALKNHPFFKGVDFSKLHEIKPPVYEIQIKKKSSANTGSDKKKEEPEKIKIKEFPKVPSIIDKDITITLSGLVEKKCGWIFYKPRQLILNSKPRLMYYDPNTNQLRVETIIFV
jgi:serine/threonine protein kinase